MAAVQLRDDLIAARYEGVARGPRVFFSFETQESYPVDSTNPLLRDLSPFTLRFVPPQIIGAERPARQVGLIGRANSQIRDLESSASAVRSLFGGGSVTGEAGASERLARLQQIVSAGQVVSGATTDVERAVLTDSTTAADIAYQVERILQTPPLTLLINPSEMGINYGTIQNYSDRTREGFVFQRWGETQPTISFSGSTGGFIAAANPQGAFGEVQQTTVPSGFQFANKRESAAFQNFVSLYQFYRNGGYIFDTVRGSEAHLMVGAVAIDYDQFTYVGHIESFDVNFTSEDQHRVQWSMEFIVDDMIDRASTPVSVQPMRAPQPNPSYPTRTAQRFPTRPDATSGGAFQTSGDGPAVAEVPLGLLGAFGVGG